MNLFEIRRNGVTFERITAATFNTDMELRLWRFYADNDCKSTVAVHAIEPGETLTWKDVGSQ